jgi:hypothetical protein
MRILTIVILALLILSCEKQPVTFEPDTKVSQSIPAGQIGPQINTLFTSWREFENYKDPYPQPISIIERHYKNQLDNGLFGLPMGVMTYFGNYTSDPEKWAAYKSITFSFTFVTTGVLDDFSFVIEMWHYDRHDTTGHIWTPISRGKWIRLGPNNSSHVFATFYPDSDLYEGYTYRDMNCMSILYFTYWGPNSETNLIYSAYVSELLVTAEQRQDVQGKGE